MGFQKFSKSGISRSQGVRATFYNSGIGCLSAALTTQFEDEVDAIELFYNPDTGEIGIKPCRSTDSIEARKLIHQEKSRVRTFSGKGFLEEYNLSYPSFAELTKDANGMYIGKLTSTEVSSSS
tara:strand:- start:303 stop:671 length:369 start_codon:yes stop_codon:yes gene_type:complete